MQASDQSPLDLSALTAPQREAVEHVDGPLLILAGPGSGKTRVVTHRIANLLSLGVPAHQILALTFTNKAADEMRERVHTLAPGARVTLGTFHRFCARLLRQYAPHVGLAENFTIYDTDDSLKAFKQALEQAKVELARYQPEQVRHRISWLKNHLLGVANFEPRPGHALDSIVARVLPLYQAKLLSSNAVDFDDLLLHVAQLLRDQPEVRRELDARYRYVLVDEYQDTNLAQYAIARGLSIDFPNLAVTGDPDQSIYGWRGANLGNILDFERDYPQVRVVRLEQNYRSTKCILRVADALISNNRRRKAKELFTDNDEGRPVALVRYPNNRDEAAAIAERIATEVTAGRRRPRDFAIFYRTNALSRSLELALHDRGIPFQLIKGVEFFQRKEIKDVMAYLHLVNNPRDDVALARIINTPARGIGASTVKRLAAHAADRRFSLLDAAREAGLVPDLSKGAAVKVAKFVSLFDRLSLAAAAPLEELMGQVLMESGYRQVLVEAAAAESDSEEAQDRLANIEELLTVAREFDEQHPGGGGLEEFLEQNALVNDIDDWTTENDKVVLMTMHSAKGLEFPVVFIVAVEEGLLPHERSRDHPDKLEEERRLLFVGITRAREELELSYAKSRDFRGQRRPTIPSQFLMELPRDEMEVAEPGWSFEEFSDAGDDVFAADAHDGTLDGPLDGSLDGPLDGPTAAEVEVFNELSELVRDSSRPAEARSGLNLPPLLTAADLSAERGARRAGDVAISPPVMSAPAVPPDVFTLGMLVTHPLYGLGKITALSGTGKNRTATINFASHSGQKKFVLSASPLRPAKKGER